MELKSTGNVWFSFILSLFKIKLMTRDKKTALHLLAEKKDARRRDSSARCWCLHTGGNLGATLLHPREKAEVVALHIKPMICDLPKSDDFRASLKSPESWAEARGKS